METRIKEKHSSYMKTLLKEKPHWMKTFNGKYTMDEYTLMGLDICEWKKSTFTKKKRLMRMIISNLWVHQLVDGN